MTEAWQNAFDRLVQYRSIHGDCLVPRSFLSDQNLANWVSAQRAARQDGSITLERTEKLDSIGFVWNVDEDRWEKMFRALQEFKNEHGHCEPRPDEVSKQLYTWLQTQRHYLKYDKHSPDRALRLKALGITHSLSDIAWNRHLEELREFINTHGHCNILNQFRNEYGHSNISVSPFYNNLYCWLRQQRLAFEAGELPENKRLVLEKLGFALSPPRRRLSYDDMLPILTGFRDKHGHLNVRKDQDPVLRKWCVLQRSAHNRGRLREVYDKALESIGFPWTEDDALGQEMIIRLAKFRSTFGHVDVPHDLYAELNEWLSDQKQRWGRSQLSQKRTDLLVMLGIEPDETSKGERPARETGGELCP